MWSKTGLFQPGRPDLRFWSFLEIQSVRRLRILFGWRLLAASLLLSLLRLNSHRQPETLVRWQQKASKLHKPGRRPEAAKTASKQEKQAPKASFRSFNNI